MIQFDATNIETFCRNFKNSATSFSKPLIAPLLPISPKPSPSPKCQARNSGAGLGGRLRLLRATYLGFWGKVSSHRLHSGKGRSGCGFTILWPWQDKNTSKISQPIASTQCAGGLFVKLFHHFIKDSFFMVWIYVTHIEGVVVFLRLRQRVDFQQSVPRLAAIDLLHEALVGGEAVRIGLVQLLDVVVQRVSRVRKIRHQLVPCG